MCCAMLLWPAECIKKFSGPSCMQLATQSVVVNLWQQAGWQPCFH